MPSPPHPPPPAPQAVRGLAARLSSALGLRVYPYSLFHIFFEQYLTIGGEALALLGSGGWGGGGVPTRAVGPGPGRAPMHVAHSGAAP